MEKSPKNPEKSGFPGGQKMSKNPNFWGYPPRGGPKILEKSQKIRKIPENPEKSGKIPKKSKTLYREFLSLRKPPPKYIVFKISHHPPHFPHIPGHPPHRGGPPDVYRAKFRDPPGFSRTPRNSGAPPPREIHHGFLAQDFQNLIHHHRASRDS